MDIKNIFKNRSMCVLPWSGFEVEPNGLVKNCVMSKESIGDIHEDNIENIVHGRKNKIIKDQMLKDNKPSSCEGCYFQEKNTKSFDVISSRLYYLKELGPSIEKKNLDNTNSFDLRHVDLRWSNFCNQACVYCKPYYSSKWAAELGEKVESDKQARQKLKEYVFGNVKKLKNVYLAGGEPLLIKENLELLELLKKYNPEISLRVNTNLNKTKTKVFDLLCEFKNVHWILSAESTGDQYNYIRYHGNWKDFEDNLDTLKKTNHKISFNMLFFILNFTTIYETIDILLSKKCHENNFVITPLMTPLPLNVLNLPRPILQNIKSRLIREIDNRGFLLRKSYENVLKYINETTLESNLQNTHKFLTDMDQRRNQNYRQVFPELADIIDV